MNKILLYSFWGYNYKNKNKFSFIKLKSRKGEVKIYKLPNFSLYIQDEAFLFTVLEEFLLI